jgi:predicted MPP superfamily phosphohydrolase
VVSGLISGCGLRVAHVEVPIANLPAGLDGLRIAQMSDLHYVGAAGVHDRLADALAKASPDIVVFTGDYVEQPEQVEACADLIARLAAGRPAYAVPGNWEYWSGAHVKMCAALEKRGVAVLLNRNTAFARSGEKLHLAGVDDPHTAHDDLAAAFAGIPEEAPVVLLAHSPDVIERPGAERATLILCGHTHGGQIRALGRPVVKPRLARSDLVAGLYRGGKTRIYVNTGIGASVVRVRFFCPSELTLITLRAARSAARDER